MSAPLRAPLVLALLGVGCGPIYPQQPTQPAPAGGVGDPGAPTSPDVVGAPAHAPAAPLPPSSSDAQALLAAHNAVRAKYCAAPLTWSPKLAQVAQQWANSLRDHGCGFSHSGGNYGENLAAGTTGYLDANAVVAMWADEVAKYSFAHQGFSMETGHFTQLVWHGTTQVGCGKASCNGNDLWVCNYDPAGNVDDEYAANVTPAGCH